MKVERWYRKNNFGLFGFDDEENIIDNIPSRLGIRYNDSVVNKYKASYRKERHYRHYCDAYPIGETIIKNSIGKHINQVFSDLSYKFRELNTEYSAKEITTRFIDWSNYPLWKIHKSKWNKCEFGIFIDEQGYLREKKKTVQKRYCLTKEEQLIYKNRNKNRNKEERKFNKKTSLTLLSIINNPLLYGFYSSLISKRKYLNSGIIHCDKMISQFLYSIKNDTRNRERYREKNNENYYWIKTYRKDKFKYEQELVETDKQISQIESGDYTAFYNSNTYLFSIGKECPHFESPIKNK